jgi:hypothetical protein
MSSPRPSQSPSDTSSWMTLRWVRGTRDYRVHLEQDLWNEWLVTQVYGRIGSRLGSRPRAARRIDRVSAPATCRDREAPATAWL